MSYYASLVNVSRTIVNLIWENIQKDAQIKSIISTKRQICLAIPKEPKSHEDNKLFIFLYHITEDSSLRNLPISRTEPNTTSLSPLFLRLHYLITPCAQNSENDQILLEKVIQIFAENPILPKSNPQDKVTEKSAISKLTMDPFSIEDLNRLWTILRVPYRLSVSYCVSSVQVATTREKEPRMIGI